MLPPGVLEVAGQLLFGVEGRKGIGAALGGQRVLFDLLGDLGADPLELLTLDSKLHEAFFEENDGVRGAARVLDLLGAAVQALIVGVAVAVEALDAEHDDGGPARLAHLGDDLAKAPDRRDHIVAVDALNRNPAEHVLLARWQGEERAPAGARRDRERVVLDDPEDRQLAGRRGQDRLQHLALLRRAVAYRAVDDGSRGVGLDRLGDAAGVQPAAAHGAGHAHQVEVGGAHDGVHGPAAGLGGVLGEQRQEQGLGSDAAGQQERLVAVVGLQPVLLDQVGPERGGGLVAGAGDLEKRLAAARKVLLEGLDGPRHAHVAVQIDQGGHLSPLLGDLRHGYLRELCFVLPTRSRRCDNIMGAGQGVFAKAGPI